MRYAFPAARRPENSRYALASSARRSVAAFSPLFVTMLLTAAIFLLPAPGPRHEAQASAAGVRVPTIPAAFR